MRRSWSPPPLLTTVTVTVVMAAAEATATVAVAGAAAAVGVETNEASVRNRYVAEAPTCCLWQAASVVSVMRTIHAAMVAAEERDESVGLEDFRCQK